MIKSNKSIILIGLLVSIIQVNGAAFFDRAHQVLNNAQVVVDQGCGVVKKGVKTSALAAVFGGYLYAVSHLCQSAYAYDFYSHTKVLPVVQEISTRLNSVGNVLHTILPSGTVSESLTFASQGKGIHKLSPIAMKQYISDLLLRNNEVKQKLIVDPVYASTTSMVTYAKVIAADHRLVAPITVGLIGLGIGYVAWKSISAEKNNDRQPSSVNNGVNINVLVNNS